jgi:hypothetical protein
MERPFCPRCKTRRTTHTILVERDRRTGHEVWQDVCGQCFAEHSPNENEGHEIAPPPPILQAPETAQVRWCPGCSARRPFGEFEERSDRYCKAHKEMFAEPPESADVAS